jgi:hypothetical protein
MRRKSPLLLLGAGLVMVGQAAASDGGTASPNRQPFGMTSDLPGLGEEEVKGTFSFDGKRESPYGRLRGSRPAAKKPTPRLWVIELEEVSVQALSPEGQLTGPVRVISMRPPGRYQCPLLRPPAKPSSVWMKVTVEEGGKIRYWRDEGGGSEEVRGCTKAVLANMRYGSEAGELRVVAKPRFIDPERLR